MKYNRNIFYDDVKWISISSFIVKNGHDINYWNILQEQNHLPIDSIGMLQKLWIRKKFFVIYKLAQT